MTPTGRVALWFVAILVFSAGADGASLGQSEPVSEEDRARIEYGAFLITECTSCHRIGPAHRTGNFAGIPRLAAWSAEELSERMQIKLINGDPAMRVIADALTAEDIAALAAYLATAPLDDDT